MDTSIFPEEERPSSATSLNDLSSSSSPFPSLFPSSYSQSSRCFSQTLIPSHHQTGIQNASAPPKKIYFSVFSLLLLMRMLSPLQQAPWGRRQKKSSPPLQSPPPPLQSPPPPLPESSSSSSRVLLLLFQSP